MKIWEGMSIKLNLNYSKKAVEEWLIENKNLGLTEIGMEQSEFIKWLRSCCNYMLIEFLNTKIPNNLIHEFYPPTPLLDEIEEMADGLDKEKVLVVPKLDISECKQAHNVKIGGVK